MSGSDSIIEMFIYENTQLTERLEEVLIEGEREGGLNDDHINEIFRIMHTLKGSAAMMAFNNIATLAHHCEDMFYIIRENQGLEPDWAIICDIVLESVDFFKAETAKIQQGSPSETEATELLQRIAEYIPVLKGERAAAQEAPAAPDTAPAPATADTAAAVPVSEPASVPNDGKNHFTASIFFEEGCKMENIRAYQIVTALQDISEIISVPADLLDDCSDEILANGVTLHISTTHSYDKIKEKITESLFVRSFQLTVVGQTLPEPEAEAAQESAPPPPAEAPKIAAAPAVPAPAPAAAPAPAETITLKKPAPAAAPDTVSAPAAVKQSFISVSVEKLDRLLDLVGEIVITESMVTNSPDLKGLKLENFEKAASMLRKNTDELQDAVMSVRMIPISSTFHKMSRIVRDTSKKMNKEVDLVMLGEETEVDKNIIDSLSDPLMHIIRNSMDHGLEDSKDARLDAGKPAVGSIVMEAKNSGSDVILTVTDDGRGFSKERIIKKAVAQGLLTKNENDYTDKEIYQLTLLPGFSTKEAVTELSGRGVGMDVVKKNIEKIGGSISLDSTEGKGSTVTIKIPLTLAILNGMEIAVGKNAYIVPTLNIRESFKTSGGMSDIIVDPEGNEMIMLRGECYPIVRLHRMFNIKDALTSFDDGIMIIGEDDGKTIAIFADELVGEQQIVLKPIPPFITKRIGHIKGISGCTLLGDGSISLIIDVKDLY